MSKYWVRLLLFGILLGTIPVLVIGWFAYSIASSDMEEKMIESQRQILHQTQMRVEQMLRSVEISAIQFANSSAITHSLQAPVVPQDLDQIRELGKGLNHLLTFNGVSDAQIINLQHDWFLSTKRYGTTQQLYEEGFFFYNQSPKSLFWLRSSNESIAHEEEESAIIDRAHRPVIRMMLKIPPMPVTQEPRALLAIDILSSELRNFLHSGDNFNELYIIGEDGGNLLRDPRVSDFLPMNERIIHNLFQTNEPTGVLSGKIDNREMAAIYLVSPYNGWVYVSVVSIDAITAPSKKIASLTIAVCCALLIVISLIAFALSRHIYSPVRKLVEYSRAFQRTPEAASTQDEFGLIEQRIHHLSTTGKDLEQQVHAQFSQLKEFFVLKLFAGQISDADQQDRAHQYGFPVSWKRLAVLTVQIDTLADTRYCEKDRELLLYAINNIVGELLPGNSRFTPIVLEHAQATVLTWQDEDESAFRNERQRIATCIRDTISEYLQLSISVGISRPYAHITQTGAAYSESVQALKRRLGLGYQIIVHYEDIQKHGELGTAIYSRLKQVEEQWVHAIKTGDSERVDYLINQYLETLHDRAINFSEYPPILTQCIARVYQIVQEQGGSVNKVIGDRGSIERALALNSLPEIAEWLKQDLVRPVLSYLNAQAETQYLDIANQMVKLIHERFEDNLSLDNCATILNYHPVYLSRVFKKEVGVNFSEYLVEYRMNQAKQWLESTDLKISSIAERLQYTNTSAFIRTFRRLTGVTPGQYREQCDKN